MRSILSTLVTSIFPLAVPALGQAATTVSYKATGEQQVIALLNQIRAQHDLAPPAANTQLRNAARAHSADMLRRGFFDHNSPNETWVARIARFLMAPLTGESIAMGSGTYQGTTATVMATAYFAA